MSDDEARRHAPSTLRNREAIAAVLRRCLPAQGLLLEVASGTGEHCGYLAPLFPALHFQPTDAEPEALASIAAWCAGLANVRPPLLLDVRRPWPLAVADAVMCVNMLHIAPWEATPALLGGAARVLPRGGMLYLYGPYFQDGVPAAAGNIAFDADLRARNPAWGLRRLEDVAAEAALVGFGAPDVVAMPANNLSLVFRRG